MPLEEAGLFIGVRNISSLLPKILEATISISSQDFLSLCFLYSVHSDCSFRIIALKKKLIKSQFFSAFKSQCTNDFYSMYLQKGGKFDSNKFILTAKMVLSLSMVLRKKWSQINVVFSFCQGREEFREGFSRLNRPGSLSLSS